MQIMKINKERRRKEHQEEEEAKREEEEIAKVEAEDIARQALESASSAIAIILNGGNEVGKEKLTEIVDHPQNDAKNDLGSNSSRSSRHSRTSSVAGVSDLNPAMLREMFHGPKTQASNIVMINGKIMSEHDAAKYANDTKESDELKQRRYGGMSQVSKNFSFLKDEIDDDDEGDLEKEEIHSQQVCQVEINLQVPSPIVKDCEEYFGEKINNDDVV